MAYSWWIVVLAGLLGCTARTVDNVDDQHLVRGCASGCAQLRECAPDALEDLYGDEEQCRSGCQDLFGAGEACRGAAVSYLDCASDLECREWPTLLQGPANSSCGDVWSPAADACGI